MLTCLERTMYSELKFLVGLCILSCKIWQICAFEVDSLVSSCVLNLIDLYILSWFCGEIMYSELVTGWIYVNINLYGVGFWNISVN